MASDEELAQYCFPSRPDTTDKDAYLAWINLMLSYNGTPEPKIVITTKPIDDSENNISTATIESTYSPNWSGYISNLDSSGATLYTQIQADYKEPTISEVSGNCENSYWVGLGGNKTSRLVQAGTISSGKYTHYAWYEYLGDSETITVTPVNLTVNAGDNIHVYVSFQRSNNLFSYYIANNTTGKSVSGSVTLDASTQYDGTSAEWIVERNLVDGSLANLGNYGAITFTNCKATLNTSNTWHNLSSLSNLEKCTMRNGAQVVLSEPGGISSNNTFSCTWRKYK